MEKILDRFLRYVAVDTQSDPESDSQPSAAKELNLLKMLRDELKAMGVEATMDEYGYVMGSIPSNCGKDVPAVGFIAHADTAPDAPGDNIRPQIIENYDGSDIPLKGVPGLFLKPSEFPELELYKGQTLITTDGTTLLGADDKAGIAEIMNAVQYIVENPDFKHGEIKIGFTPDEEIGRGVVKFDVKKFGAKYAYTLDGGQVGELEYENFNAAGATIRIQGRNVHPGTAKGKMKTQSSSEWSSTPSFLSTRDLNTHQATKDSSTLSASREKSRQLHSHTSSATTTWTFTSRRRPICRDVWTSSTRSTEKAQPSLR